MKIKVVNIEEEDLTVRFSLNRKNKEQIKLEKDVEYELDTEAIKEGKNVLSFCFYNGKVGGDNVLRGIIFILISCLLPFSFMSFKTKYSQPNYVRFLYEEDKILLLQITTKKYYSLILTEEEYLKGKDN